MSIEFHCAQCNQRLRVSDPTPGTQARCPQCGNVQPIPGSKATAALSPATLPLPPATPYAQSANPFREDLATQPPGTQPQTPASTNPYAAPTTTASGGIDYAQRFNLASRPLRLAGAITDWAIYGLSTIPAIGMMGYGETQNNEVLYGIGVLLLFGGLFLVGLVNWVMISVSAQSLAKRLLGMRIVKTDGQLPGFLHGVVLRYWVLSWICVCYPVGVLVYVIDGLLIFGAKRQCLHDLIASTLVVKVK